ncbi:hypothetical protein JCM10914A_40730 [Paenibacillus sp. JCM 10914]
MKRRYRLQKLIVDCPIERLEVWKDTSVSSHSAQVLDNFLTHGYRIFDAEFNEIIRTVDEQ